ncbi:hypothetical protein HWV03_10410 [Moritella sp. 36]|uniref:hypothetical protein n=1 Tax=Moritella sp. 36 TaxID=2746233 RepID=UPI001BA8C69B|nr:hypothetical protein [Moritella sp. 36]QUM89181.1 hypothetical protein HWV03_10410 [Moritella sp. 36]
MNAIISTLFTYKLWAYLVVILGLFWSAHSHGETAKEQVTGLLQVIEDHNSILKDKMSKRDLAEPEIQRHLKPNTARFTANINAFLDGVRDPFSMTKSLAKLTEPDKSVAQDTSYAGYDFKNSEFSMSLPKLTLKGVVFKKNIEEPLALLDIGGHGVHMVRIGDEIGFNPALPKQVLKIKKISRLNVIVEVGTLGDLIVVR